MYDLAPPPPLAPLHRLALFLDFDGTLVPIAETPDAVVPPPGLARLLADLHGLLDGALAIVPGRQMQVLDRFLAPLRLPAACEHGMQRRDAGGRLLEQAPPCMETVLHACTALARAHAGLLVERKHSSIALHYRRAPHLRTLCLDTLECALQGQPRLQLLPGKCVFEIQCAGMDKGRAIAAFLREAPFAGRTPVFAGDDTTDESGFAAVLSRGGMAIKVGPGDTMAGHRLDSPRAVHDWLHALRVPMAAHLRAEAAA
jgi:trehalose 6-phosphate phosphatase